LIDKTQETSFVFFQTGILQVIRPNIPNEELSMGQQTHHNSLSKLYGAVIESENLALAHFVLCFLNSCVVVAVAVAVAAAADNDLTSIFSR